MTNFRAMCAELLEWAERTSSHYYKQADVIVRARALLAQSEPQPPADGEVAELCAWLRNNSSGVYRPAARAADLLERLASYNAGLEAAAESLYFDNLSLLYSQDD